MRRRKLTNKEIKAKRKELENLRLAALIVEAGINREMNALQKECPHPFAEIKWNEWIPMGCAKGICSACGDTQFSTEYSKEELDTVEFVFKE